MVQIPKLMVLKSANVQAPRGSAVNPLHPPNVSGLVQTGGVEGEVMFDAEFKLAAASLIHAAMVEDFDTAELIISQHDPYELTRAMAVISAQGWTITNGYNMARAVESLDVLASVFAEEADVDHREMPG
jgi:hypothetical protein